MKRPVVVAVFLAGLMLGTAVPVSGLGGTQITLNCDDGTSLTAVVDASTVTDRTQSVQALIDYPAGLSCTLLQTTPIARFGNAADAALTQGFVNGGGRFQVSCGSAGGTFWTNIAVNAQIKDGRVVGTVNEPSPVGSAYSLLLSNRSLLPERGASPQAATRASPSGTTARGTGRPTTCSARPRPAL